MVIADVSRHGREADERIIWQGDAVQREAGGPFIPYKSNKTIKSTKASTWTTKVKSTYIPCTES
jgi:hypothetical protein